MASSYKSVTVDIKDHVAQVTLIGPGRGNAMGPEFWSELPEVFANLDADRDVRAIVLTGSGDNFSYGMDLKSMAKMWAPLIFPEGSFQARTRADFHAGILDMQKAPNAVANCRTPDRKSVV